MSSVLPAALTLPSYCRQAPLVSKHCRRQPCYDPASARERYEASGAVSGEPGTRSARENTRRRCASSKHARLGCRYAPLPGCRAWGSGTITSPAATRRSKLDLAARPLHPTQVRTGFFPVSGSSVRAVIASLVYRVAVSGVPGEVRGKASSRAGAVQRGEPATPFRGYGGGDAGYSPVPRERTAGTGKAPAGRRPC